MNLGPFRALLVQLPALALLASAATAQTISSPSDRVFHVGDSATAIGSITVVDDATPRITAANDIRIRIPAGFPSSLSGTRLYHAYVVFRAKIDFASTPVPLTLTP